MDSLSIIIPAFNEEPRLELSLRKLAGFASRQRDPVVREIIVVDDGSRDATAIVANRMRRECDLIRPIPYLRNAGKGYAIRRGVIEADAELILITDADLSTPMEELEKLLAAVRAGADVAIGSRGAQPETVKLPQGRLRRSMGLTFNRMVKLITGLPFHDTQCGFKLFRREAAKELFRDAVIDRFAWDVEVLLLASRKNLRVVEVPVAWFNSADSRVHVVRDSAAMLRDVARITARVGRWRG